MSGCGGAARLGADTQGSAVLRPAARLLGLVYLRARVCIAQPGIRDAACLGRGVLAQHV